MDDRRSSGSFNAFLLGTIFGGALIFLLGTKKGRKILRDLTDAGSEMYENLSNIEDIEEFSDDLEQDASSEAAQDKAKENGESFGKRFFKGAKKKSH